MQIPSHSRVKGGAGNFEQILSGLILPCVAVTAMLSLWGSLVWAVALEVLAATIIVALFIMGGKAVGVVDMALWLCLGALFLSGRVATANANMGAGCFTGSCILIVVLLRERHREIGGKSPND